MHRNKTSSIYYSGYGVSHGNIVSHWLRQYSGWTMNITHLQNCWGPNIYLHSQTHLYEINLKILSKQKSIPILNSYVSYISPANHRPRPSTDGGDFESCQSWYVVLVSYAAIQLHQVSIALTIFTSKFTFLCKFHFAIAHNLMKSSLQNFAHAMTAQLLWYVHNFVVI